MIIIIINQYFQKSVIEQKNRVIFWLLNDKNQMKEIFYIFVSLVFLGKFLSVSFSFYDCTIKSKEYTVYTPVHHS